MSEHKKNKVPQAAPEPIPADGINTDNMGRTPGRYLYENFPESDLEEVRESQAYIAGHYREKVNWTDLAGLTHFSTDHLSKLFNRELGVSLPDYVHTLRIREASQILKKDRTISCADVAEQVGYRSVSYFSVKFKKFHDRTPRQYRRESQQMLRWEKDRAEEEQED